MYIPKRGDIVKMDFDPTLGHEQGGVRPGLILSETSYNNFSGMCLMVPITSKIKNFSFEVGLGIGHKIKGVVLSDQIRSVDWRARRLSFLENCNEDVMEEVLRKSRIMLQS